MKYKGRLVIIGIIILYSFFHLKVLHEPIQKQILDSVFAFLLALFFGYQYDKMQFLAEKDFLTQTYNRRYGFKIFPKIKKKISKDKSSLGIFVIDINDFKRINDKYGHEVGDTVLKEVAKLLIMNTRKKDVVIRWGGDEFVIIAPTYSNKDAESLIKRIEKILKVEIKKYKDVNVGLSIGYSIFPTDGESLDELINVADTYMYNMKTRQKFSAY